MDSATQQYIQALTMTADEVALLVAGKKIAAITSLRERFGLALVEAKYLADRYDVAIGHGYFETLERECSHCNGRGFIREERYHTNPQPEHYNDCTPSSN